MMKKKNRKFHISEEVRDEKIFKKDSMLRVILDKEFKKEKLYNFHVHSLMHFTCICDSIIHQHLYLTIQYQGNEPFFYHHEYASMLQQMVAYFSSAVIKYKQAKSITTTTKTFQENSRLYHPYLYTNIMSMCFFIPPKFSSLNKLMA